MFSHQCCPFADSVDSRGSRAAGAALVAPGAAGDARRRRLRAVRWTKPVALQPVHRAAVARRRGAVRQSHGSRRTENRRQTAQPVQRHRRQSPAGEPRVAIWCKVWNYLWTVCVQHRRQKGSSDFYIPVWIESRPELHCSLKEFAAFILTRVFCLRFPKQMLREFQRYKELVKRPSLSKELITER